MCGTKYDWDRSLRVYIIIVMVSLGYLGLGLPIPRVAGLRARDPAGFAGLERSMSSIIRSDYKEVIHLVTNNNE